MPVVAGEARIITIQVRIERIAEDGMFHCDVNPLHDQAEWMSITGQRVRIAMCEQCKREFEQAVVE